MIAHRFDTIRRANIIFVLEEGGIHQQGTHDELIAQDGLYAHLNELQFHNGKSLAAESTGGGPHS